MNKVGFQEISIKEISPNPHNPRKGFAGPKFDELVESIRQKGIIEPIIVRPLPLNIHDKGRKIAGLKAEHVEYEIVAGDRRFKAAQILKLEKVPAVVRDLTDDEAFDFMIVENLQREDLTETEEAESFKAYLLKHGQEGAVDLAQRTGIRPQYIRRRVAVLDLPAKIIDAWRKGTIVYGHLEQLLRVKETGARDKLVGRLLCLDDWRKIHTVADLKEVIDNEAPDLGRARFDLKDCSECGLNSAVQKNLFGLDAGKRTLCLDPKCFKKKLNDWLQGHWKESEYHRIFKTNGFRFEETGDYDSKVRGFYNNGPWAKCRECPHFVTTIDLQGAVGKKTACTGDESCMKTLSRVGRKEESKAVKKDSNAPRVAWHGEYFRNVFFRKRVPQILGALDPEDPKLKTLLLTCLAYANSEARRALRKSLGLKGDPWHESKTSFPKLLELPYEKIKPIFRDVVEAVFLEGQNVGDWNGFGSANRRLAAEFLGVDLAKEWAADAEYLQKKTRAELLAFGKKSGIFADKKVKDYLQKNFNKKAMVENIKKSELVDVFLKSDVPLTGKVPDEILKKVR